MKNQFDIAAVASLRQTLDQHPVYAAVRTLDDLRLFMQHHVYSVWDFMSVVKYLQQEIAPTTYPWRPRSLPSVRYFINQLVLEEESDRGLPDAQGNPTYASHFELYCAAMREVGADPAPVLGFVDTAARHGIASALALDAVPEASRRFVSGTFEFLASGKPHAVAAAFALGREHIIPGMFRSFLANMGISEGNAPMFHYYLKRHIYLDADFHGPISLQLLNELCAGDETKLGKQRPRPAPQSRRASGSGMACSPSWVKIRSLACSKPSTPVSGDDSPPRRNTCPAELIPGLPLGAPARPHFRAPNHEAFTRQALGPHSGTSDQERGTSPERDEHHHAPGFAVARAARRSAARVHRARCSRITARASPCRRSIAAHRAARNARCIRPWMQSAGPGQR